MESLLQDLRFTLRTLRRTPAFPVTAIATLAIGIAATTAIFSTVNAALLKPLPYPNSEDLYSLRTTLTDGRVTTGNLAPVEIFRLMDPKLSVIKAAGLNGQDLTLIQKDGTPIKTRGYVITSGFFDLFGLPMTFGRQTTTEPSPNTPPSVVISYRVWQDMYAGDPDVIGKPLRFAEVTAAVGAVAPRDFDTPHGADFWVEFPQNPNGVAHNFEGFMRVKPGTTIERARSELQIVMEGLAKEFPDSAKNRIYIVRPLVEQIVGELGPILIVVLAATGLLLVLACVNVTNLLLARGAARAREMAVRVALGAGHARLVRQLLTESILLSAVGAVLGVAAAYAFVRLLQTMGASQLPRLDEVAFDGRVLMFALVALFVSGVLVGLAPAIRLARVDVNTLMNESGRSQTGGRGTRRWLSVLTVAEVALAVILVTGAGWLVRSFENLRHTNSGFQPALRLVFDVGVFGPSFNNNDAVHGALDGLLERLRGLSGVVAAGSTFNFPLRGGPENSLFVHFTTDPADSSYNYNSRQRIVSPGFFKAMGIQVIGGRDFNGDDRPNTPRVAIVNRAFAARYLSGRDPLTMQFNAGYPTLDLKTTWTVIGVVDDVRQRSLSVAAEPAYYASHGQGTPNRQAIVVHAAAGDSEALRSAIRAEVRKIDPQIPVEFERLTDFVRSTISRQELGMTLMLGFGAAAIALAAIGIYGVTAYSAAQQRNEMAIRLALGATSQNVFWLTVRQGRTLALVGSAIGVLVAYVSGRLVSNWLFEVRASDPFILGAATLLVIVIAIVATVIPAYRAAQLEPARVLRPET